MNASALRRLAVALGVLIIAWAALKLWRRTERDAPEQLALTRIDTAHVDTITIRHAADTVRLARASQGWTVNGFEAAPASVGDLLAALGDTTARGELVSENASSHATLGVDSASAKEFTVRGGGKILARYLLGHRDASYDGVYLRLPGRAAAYDVRSRIGESMDRTANDWRDKRILALSPDSVHAVEVQRGRVHYTLQKSGMTWTLAGGQAADSAAVASWLGEFKEVNATGFAGTGQADSAKLRVPDRRVRLIGAQQRPLAVLTFDSTATGFWVRRDSAATVYLVDAYTANRLAPSDSAFRKKKM